MEELYIKVSDIGKVSNPYMDEGVKQYTAKEIAQRWLKACDCIYRDTCDYEVSRIIWCPKGRR